MKMKTKLTTVALAGLVGTATSSWGMEGVIDDPNFTKEGTIASIRMVVENGTDLMVMVDATGPNEKPHSKLVKAMVAPLGPKYDNENGCAYEQVNAQVICGSQILQKPYTKAKKFPNNLVSESLINSLDGENINDNDLPLGKLVNVRKQQKFQRTIDNTFYNQTSPLLYQATAKAFYNGKEVKENELLAKLPLDTPINVYKLEPDEPLEEDSQLLYKLIKKENRVGKGQVQRCYEHKDEWQQRGFKGYNQLRHWWETYNSTEVTSAIYKLSLDGQEALLPGLSKTELLLNLVNRDSGRTNKAECAPNGQSFPANSRVI